MHNIVTNDVRLGKKLADELKTARRRSGLRQIDLAIKANVALRTLQRYETAKSTPDADSLRRIGQVLGTPSHDLLDAARRAAED